MSDEAQDALDEIQAIETLARSPFSPETIKYQQAALAAAAVFALVWNNLADLAKATEKITTVPLKSAQVGIFLAFFLGVYWFIRFYVEARVELKVAKLKREVLNKKIQKQIEFATDLVVQQKDNQANLMKYIGEGVAANKAFGEEREVDLREIAERFATELATATEDYLQKKRESEKTDEDPSASPQAKGTAARAAADAGEHELNIRGQILEAKRKVYAKPYPDEYISDSFLALLNSVRSADELYPLLKRLRHIVATSNRRQRVTRYLDMGAPIVALGYMLLCSTFSVVFSVETAINTMSFAIRWGLHLGG